MSQKKTSERYDRSPIQYFDLFREQRVKDTIDITHTATIATSPIIGVTPDTFHQDNIAHRLVSPSWTTRPLNLKTDFVNLTDPPDCIIIASERAKRFQYIEFEPNNLSQGFSREF